MQLNAHLEKERAFSLVSAQVSHDIRSPLMALEVALRDARGFPPEKRDLLRKATIRIRSIADDMLDCTRKRKVVKPERLDADTLEVDAKELSRFPLRQSIQKILEEKVLSYPTVEFVTDNLNGGFEVQGSPIVFERIVANLLQNSIEATAETDKPRVQIAIRSYSSKLQLTIMDNGVGIPSNILSRIGEVGFSYGKQKGNGFGVSFAKSKISEWGGDLQIFSSEGQGTMVNLNFPVEQV